MLAGTTVGYSMHLGLCGLHGIRLFGINSVTFSKLNNTARMCKMKRILDYSAYLTGKAVVD